MPAIARLLLALVLLPGPVRAQGSDSPDLRVERLAEGVYAVIRTDPPGLMFEANSGFIVGDRDVIVIDGGSNPASARRVLAEVRRVTDLPVRWLVKTHWHDDHMLGSQVYEEAFPGVEIVAHASTREDMAGEGVTARRQFREGAPQAIASVRSLLERGTGMEGGPLTPEERESHLATLRLAEHALAQAGESRPLLPTMTFEERTTLVRGDRVIEILHLGRGHTRGDVVVHLPGEGIVFAGDLVSLPVPLVGTTSFPGEFGPTLDRLIALGARTLVPGHGPVQHDDAHLRLTARMLHSIREQTAAAVARGETLEQARRSVELGEFRRAIAGEGKVANLLFSQYVAGPAVARAYQEAASSTPPRPAR